MPEPGTAASPLPVADLDWCDSCGDLVVRGACRSCEAERRREQVREQARLRPTWVFVGESSGASDDDAVLPVPAEASELAQAVAAVAAHEASIRLACGDTLDFALCKVALGRDEVTRALADRGIVHDRKTIAAALAELVALGVLERVGQLDSWRDPDDEITKKGAFVYALKVRCRKLGSRGIEAIRRLASRSAPSSAAVRGESSKARIDRCLTAAIREAQIGQRNRIGHWLACRCTDVGLTEAEAMTVMRTYREAVPDPRSYTPREVKATVRSRYSASHGPPRRSDAGW